MDRNLDSATLRSRGAAHGCAGRSAGTVQLGSGSSTLGARRAPLSGINDVPAVSGDRDVLRLQQRRDATR